MQQTPPQPAPIKTRRWNVSLVWIVPIVALLVGASLVVRNWMQEGPTLTITFRTGEGLVANKTEVRYRNLVIGQVTSIKLAEDKKSVKARCACPRKRSPSPARIPSSGWCVRASEPAASPGWIRCYRAASSAPTPASPRGAPNISPGWNPRRPSPTARRASASSSRRRTLVRWTLAPLFTIAGSRWAR